MDLSHFQTLIEYFCKILFLFLFKKTMKISLKYFVYQSLLMSKRYNFSYFKS